MKTVGSSVFDEQDLQDGAFLEWIVSGGEFRTGIYRIVLLFID